MKPVVSLSPKQPNFDELEKKRKRDEYIREYQKRDYVLEYKREWDRTNRSKEAKEKLKIEESLKSSE